MTMSTVREIEAAIKKLKPKQLAELRQWFAALDAQEWDGQFEDDVAAGRLDAIADKAIDDFKKGRCTDL